MYHFKTIFFCLILLAEYSYSQSVSDNNKESYWPKVSPKSVGVNPLVIDSIHHDIKNGKYGLINQFVMIRNGKLVADYSYKNDYKTISKKYDTINHQYNYDHPDWYPYYKNTNLHTLQSVTKSITSALIGIAIDEKLISGTDLKIMKYLSEYKIENNDSRREAITLKDLLTMRSGIEWDENNYEDAQNSCVLLEADNEWISFVLNQPMDAIPGTIFEYNSGASVLLGKLLRACTGKRIDAYAEEKLFKPLGITNYYWKITPDGEIDTEGGLYLSTTDLAKIGYLFLQKGKWEGEQIISESWISESTSPIVEDINPKNNRKIGYGYQWWIPKHAKNTTEIFNGNGYGGQYIMVDLKYNMIVVINSWNIHGRSEKSAWKILEKRILPNTKL